MANCIGQGVLLLALLVPAAAVCAQSPEQSQLDTIPVSPALPDEPGPPTEDTSTGAQIGEIVVTAQKRSENLQDVPISITAVTGEQLDTKGIETVTDMATVTPGLQINEFAGYQLIYIRGVGTDAFLPSAAPSIATYIDGVYFPSGHSLSQSFGGVQRIEVLKGPQGTLFGRNSTGGAINIITGTPGDTPESSVRVGYAKFNDLTTRASITTPLTDWLSVGASGFYNKADSYYDRDEQYEEGLAEEIGKGARLKAAIRPFDSLLVELTGMRLQRSGPGSTLIVNKEPTPLGQALLIQGEERDYISPSDDNPYAKHDTKAYYGTITWNTSRFDTKLIGSDYKVKTTGYLFDFDGSERPLVSSSPEAEIQNVKTVDLQFLSNDESWGSDWFKWVGGLFYLKDKGGYINERLLVANSIVTLPTTGELVDLLPPGVRDGLLGLGLPNVDRIGLNNTGLLGTRSKSAYLQVNLAVTERIGVTLGTRYTDETRTLLQADTGVPDTNGDLITLLSFPSEKSTAKKFSNKASVDFRLADDVLVYGGWSTGFKSATYNVVNVYAKPDFVNPEEVTAYELGVKSDLLDGSLRVNGAIFQNKIKNLQTTALSLLEGGAVSFQNAGGAKIEGAEIDLTWLPLPTLNPGLTFTLGGSYLDSKYTSFPNGSGYNEAGLYTTGNDYTGNRVVRTPEYTYNADLNQTVEFNTWSVEAAASYYYNDGFFYLPQNGVTGEPSYGVVGARLGVTHIPSAVRITVFGDNVTDERYNASQFFTDFGRSVTLAPPRTYGVRIDWSF